MELYVASRETQGNHCVSHSHSRILTGVKMLKKAAARLRRRQPSLSETAKQLGRRGGQARAENMTAEQRRDAARKAVQARWAKVKQKPSAAKAKPSSKGVRNGPA
jgi:hypothetical protein